MSEEDKDKCPLCGQEIDEKAEAEKVRLENLKELYKRYQECRDFELKKFWENSKYIWIFLSVCFTAYGFLISKLLGQNWDINHYHYIFSIAVSIIGIILSYLWFKMAKTLKYWYEVFEIAIWEMESYENVFNYDSKYLIHNYWTTKKELETPSSPSKIVIHISIFLIIFWVCALIFALLFIKHFGSQYITTGCTLCIYISCIIYFVCDNKLESSVLRNKEEENVFKHIKSDFFQNNEHLYFEIEKYDDIKFVVFKFNENNANKSNVIYSLYGKPYSFEGFDMKYLFSDIENYYEKVELKCKQIVNRIHNNEALKSKVIIRKGRTMILFSDEPENDLTVIQEQEEFKDAVIDKEKKNQIIIQI